MGLQQTLPHRHGQAMENSQDKRLQTLRGEMGVYHSLPTPSGVEKSIENPLNLTRGAAPPLSRKKRTLRRELTPGYPDIEIFFIFCFEKLPTNCPGEAGDRGGASNYGFGYVAQIDIGKWVCCVVDESRILHAAA